MRDGLSDERIGFRHTVVILGFVREASQRIEVEGTVPTARVYGPEWLRAKPRKA